MEGPDPAVLLPHSVSAWLGALGSEAPARQEHAPRAYTNQRIWGGFRGCLGKSSLWDVGDLYGHVGCRVGVASPSGHWEACLGVGGALCGCWSPCLSHQAPGG